MPHVVECLPTKEMALSSNQVPQKNPGKTHLELSHLFGIVMTTLMP
jgi:hypothetical protein